MGLGGSKSNDGPPRGPSSASSSLNKGGARTGRAAVDAVGAKLKKKWPQPGQIVDDAHLQELVTDYMAPASLFEQHFSHYENPHVIDGKFSQAQVDALRIYQAQCANMLPVKMVMSALPVAEGNWSRLAGFAARNIMDAKFGLSHIDFLVGDRLVGWFDDSLVGIKSMDHKGALRRVVAVFDLHPNIRIAESRAWLQKLCTAIAQWNTDFTYDQKCGRITQVKERNAANCQGFAAWMIDYMGLNDQYLGGVIGEFTTNFLNNPGGWWNTVALRGKRIPLSSHEAFDQWVIKEYSGRQWVGEDYDFLKGIDRGFWMRYKAQQVFIDDEQHKSGGGDAKKLEVARAELLRMDSCKNHNGEKRCPFGNPLPYEARIPEVVEFNDVKFSSSVGVSTSPLSSTATAAIPIEDVALPTLTMEDSLVAEGPAPPSLRATSSRVVFSSPASTGAAPPPSTAMYGDRYG